jgi:hypothetical protein
VIGESDGTYWPRQLSVATVFGFVVFLVSFLGGGLCFLSYLNYVSPHGKQHAMMSFVLALITAFFLSGMVFAAVMWRGWVRRKRELAMEED